MRYGDFRKYFLIIEGVSELSRRNSQDGKMNYCCIESLTSACTSVLCLQLSPSCDVFSNQGSIGYNTYVDPAFYFSVRNTPAASANMQRFICLALWSSPCGEAADFQSDEEVKMAVRKGFRIKHPDFYGYGIFKLVPSWNKCITVLGNCA
jgi:hypothetical protein